MVYILVSHSGCAYCEVYPLNMDFLKKSRQTLILLYLFLDLSACVEEYQREIFLAPRNFNPHPYEHQLAKIQQDPGPVVFPAESQEDPVISNRYNIITVEKAGRKYPIDVTPYAKVAQKIKNFINKKYIINKPSQIDSDEIYTALARQGPKVLTYPPQDLKSVNLLPNNYAFAYKVLDKATGDDFSHQQVRSSKATNGEYRVKLPDGRLQIVSYKADKNGYKADVRYEVDPEVHYQRPEPAENPKLALYVPENQIPVRQFVPRQRVKSYQYVPEEVPEDQHQNTIYIQEQGPTQVPVNYVHQTTPNPAYYVSHVPQQPNVHIYTTNPRDYSSTTPATPVYDRQPVRYTSTPATPTVHAQIVHNGDHGLYQPSVVSSYAPPVAQSASPGHNNVINTLSSSSKQSDAYRETLEKENELPEGIYIVGKPRK